MKNMKHLLLLAISLFGSSIAFSAEDELKLFVKLSPAGSFTAKSDKVKGDLIKDGSTFKAEKLTVLISSFKTGMSLRDEHFCKHLKCESNPKATLSDFVATNGVGKGTLEVAGVKKPIEVAYLEKGTQLVGTLKFKASEFGLPPAKYLGVGVNDDVTGEVTVTFKNK
jgi:hypothetical protein